MGRKPLYTEAKLLKSIEAYFEQCQADKVLPNKAGICLHLAISRETYNQYRQKFPDAIKKADFTIEDAWVNRLNGAAPTGAIFYLKNAFKDEYKDRNETDVTTGGQPFQIMWQQQK